MELDVTPRLSVAGSAVLEQALAEAGIAIDETPALYRSAWRLAAAQEAVEYEPGEEGYALSPRRTRGATRA